MMSLHVERDEWSLTNNNSYQLLNMKLMILILGHRMSHELLDPTVLHIVYHPLQMNPALLLWYSLINITKQFLDLFHQHHNEVRCPWRLLYSPDFHKLEAFLYEDQSSIISLIFEDLMLWCLLGIYIYLSALCSFLFPFFFFFVYTESVCSGQNICGHLCVYLPVTWNNSYSFINVEPPRLSKQNPALNGWLYLLLQSYSSDLLSFHPQKCCFCYSPFGYIHRHTCVQPLYKKQMCALCKYGYTQSLIHTSIHVHMQNRRAVCCLFSADGTSAAQMCTVLWGAAVCRMFCIPSVEHVRRSCGPSVWLH